MTLESLCGGKLMESSKKIASTLKLNISVLLWCGVAWIVSRTINSEVYVDILEHYLIRSIEDGFCDSSDFLFQDDDAFSHGSKQVKNFIDQNKNSPIKTMN